MGSKRAVVALAQEIKISSRYENLETFRLDYDDEWLKTEDWNLEYRSVPDINVHSTRIELFRLRGEGIQNENIQDLKEHLEITYANFIREEKIKIILNDTRIRERSFTQWSFLEGYPPQKFTKELIFKNGEKVLVEITAG